MAYTRQEEAAEFWQLTKGILQDARVDTDEAQVIKRWLEEHKTDDSFDRVIAKLAKFLEDGYIDRFESQELCNSIGSILRLLKSSGQK